MKAHWTPRYIFNRINLYLFEKQNPNLPWLTADAIAILPELLKPTDIGLEFGSGRSTKWFAKHCKHLTSVEDNLEWYNIVKQMLGDEQVSNVNYNFLNSSHQNPKESDYYKIIDTFANESLDFILIDGSLRDILAVRAMDKLKKGGLLIVDNANWSLPHKTQAPTSAYQSKKASNAIWQQFYDDTLLNYRLIWTSNGVTDTAIFIKK